MSLLASIKSVVGSPVILICKSWAGGGGRESAFLFELAAHTILLVNGMEFSNFFSSAFCLNYFL